MATTEAEPAVEIRSGEPNEAGYRPFELGEFTFRRDDYFIYIDWPTGSHVMSADAFLKALQRDVAWDFFYGIVNFDGVIGTVNHYGTVDLFAGRYNDGYRRAITRHRVAAARMVGVKGDEQIRSDEGGFPVNRHFADVAQDEPEIRPEPGFEDELASFNLFAYLSRSDVTWNPSVVSACKDSLFCPTTEEYILPIIHGNDRVEWFVQLSDQIYWDVEDRDSGQIRSKVVMKPGDVAAMPADIRHQGYAPKRSMLLVWENAAGDLPELISSGKLPTYPVEL
jgi:hypothetical protein